MDRLQFFAAPYLGDHEQPSGSFGFSLIHRSVEPATPLSTFLGGMLGVVLPDRVKKISSIQLLGCPQKTHMQGEVAIQNDGLV